MRLSGLKIQCCHCSGLCHCCGAGSNPGLGTSACLGSGKEDRKQERKKEEKEGRKEGGKKKRRKERSEGRREGRKEGGKEGQIRSMGLTDTNYIKLRGKGLLYDSGNCVQCLVIIMGYSLKKYN